MNSKKRGQITVFVIIGLIVLLTYFLLSYYKKESIGERELIQPELIPVQQYVETCTKNLAREAIDIIGLNGGYIYFPAWIENDPASYLKLGPVDELKNPYWRYDGKTAIPPLDFIAEQISDYTKERIGNCLDNFSAFHNKYNIIELGKFDVITGIDEEDITVEVTYPIEVQDKFNKTLAELQKYIVVVPIRLKKAHELAGKIIERENKDYFVENRVMDLISLDDDEIPTTGIEIKCGRKRWELGNIENKLRSLLQANLPYIKVKGTNFDENSRITPYQLQDVNPFSSSNSYKDSYYYYHYIWDVSDVHYPNMHVSFVYDNRSDIMLYARPNKGRYLESNPQRGGQILSLLCMHIWHFTYDIIFPIKVTIVDDETDNNERYAFTFAFKAQINHNEPDTKNFAITSFDTKDTYMEEEYCADARNEILINTDDEVTDEGIGGVNLSFTCGRYTCNMGRTEVDAEAGTAYLKKRFPYCAYGVIKGTKDGYEDTEDFIGTGREGTDPEKRIGGAFTLNMRPIKMFNFSVVKHKMVNEQIGGENKLDDDEKAMITLKAINLRLGETGFESYGTYPSNETGPLKLLNGRGIIDFRYDLEIYLTDNENIIGGYSGEWGADKGKIELGKNITFHVIEKDFKSDEERYAFFTGLKEYSKKAPLPEIK